MKGQTIDTREQQKNTPEKKRHHRNRKKTQKEKEYLFNFFQNYFPFSFIFFSYFHIFFFRAIMELITTGSYQTIDLTRLSVNRKEPLLELNII